MRSRLFFLVVAVLLLPRLAFAAPLILTHSLALGDTGSDVTSLQQYLRDAGFFTYPTNTGYYGPVTTAAVSAFQKANGLPQVGVVGPLTRALVGKLSQSSQQASAPPVTASTFTVSKVTSTPVLPIVPNAAVTSASGGVVITPRHHSVVAGPSYPAWLPQAPSGDYPAIYADPVNNHYWAGGTEVTVNDILVQNTDWSAFDTSTIVPGVGFKGTSSFAPVIADQYATPLLLSGYTYVATITRAAPNLVLTVDFELTDVPNYHDEWYSIPYFNSTADVNSSVAWYHNATHASASMADVLGDGTHKASGSITPSSISLSQDGSSIIEVIPPSRGALATTIALSLGGDGQHPGYMTSFAIYPPQPSSDLPTLSAP